jgi:site-specific DNA-methyltransferase (adenine-specific)
MNQPTTHILHLGDCLDILPTLPDGCADAIITDLPYGTTACKWDVIIPLDAMWAQVKRVLKLQGVFVTTAQQPFTSVLIGSNLDWFRYEWIWRKTKASNFLHAPNMPLKVTENIAVFSSGIVGHQSLTDNRMTYYPQGIRESKTFVKQNKNSSALRFHRESQTNHTVGYRCKNENYPSNLLEFKNDTDGLHPTQKPVALYEYLIKTYTNPGDTVLDFCMGSGTTGVAAIRTSRNFIGIEKEANYFEIAQRRITEAQQIGMPL